jgi:hypothetical protein
MTTIAISYIAIALLSIVALSTIWYRSLRRNSNPAPPGAESADGDTAGEEGAKRGTQYAAESDGRAVSDVVRPSVLDGAG